MKELEVVDYLAVTTDGWRSKYTNENYEAITLHYQDPRDPCVQKFVVFETLPFGDEAHAAVNIAA